MKILHTSDWHLGNHWSGRSRQKEFSGFLDWMIATLKTERPDALIVAGDIFDTGNPGPMTQTLYFEFLRQAAPLCRTIVITAGNHDSPALLDAPRPLLRTMNIHVVGVASTQPKDELVVLEDENGRPELIIAAVPFLRDRDIRSSEAGESPETKDRKTVEGIRRHYVDVCAAAEKLRSGCDIPLVATGHLFASGGVVSEGLREIHVGTLGQLDIGLFPKEIDYLALGHLHIAQMVDKSESRRYSGSPMPMSFSEAGQRKQVLRVEFEGRIPTVESIEVPEFSHLVRIRGDLNEIRSGLSNLKNETRETFVEIEYAGNEMLPELQQTVEEIAARLPENIVILRVRNDRIVQLARLHAVAQTETLEELTPQDVFRRLLDSLHEQAKDRQFDADLERELFTAYREILQDLP